jgi:hypothetical protein
MEITLNINANINQKLETFTANPTNAVAAGGFENQIITPPVGYIGRITSIFIDINSSGTSGENVVYVIAGQNIDLRAFSIVSGAASEVALAGVAMIHGTSIPASDIALIEAIKSIRFDNANPLVINYMNDTNAAQTGRSYGVQYVLEAENTDF